MTYSLSKKSTAKSIRPSRITLNRARAIAVRSQPSNASGPQRVERVRFTFEEKLKICERYYLVKPTLNQAELCTWAKEKFQLAKEPSQPTISIILRKYSELKQLDSKKLDSFSNKGAEFPELEEELIKFVKTMEDATFGINSHSLRHEAEFLCRLKPELLNGKEKPNFSQGWLDNFMKRNNLRCRLMNGEAGSVDMSSPVILLKVEEIKAKLACYDRRDIYNFDETGLFYRQAPQKTISTRDVAGGKVDKTRLTIGFMCNADGSRKEEPLIIGNAEKPVCFKGKDGLLSISKCQYEVIFD